jgi:endonuclease YncB( thermonuclease family)
VNSFLYHYEVLSYSVVDGDTLDLAISLGLRIDTTLRCRLFGPDPEGPLGLNAPELNTPEGQAAKAGLVKILADAGRKGSLVARTIRDSHEKYGRWLVTILAVDAAGAVVSNVNDELVKGGFAVLKKY